MANTPIKNQVKATLNHIALTWELDAKGKDSKTGKSMIHLSTGGFQDIPDSDYRYSLLVISTKKSKK